jgi:hypothetical protein
MNAMRRWETQRSSALARGGLLLLAGAFTFVACGCAGARDANPSASVVVWEGSKDQWVRLAPRDDAGAPPNEHPAQIAPAEVTAALASLSVAEDDGTEPIFTSQEAGQLGEAVSRALAQARPDQDVTFRSAGSRSLTSGKVLKGVSVNSGRIFRQGGQLNLIFGDVRTKSRTKAIYGQWEEEFSEPRPAVRGANPGHEWRVVAPEGVEQRNARDDWLAFDTAQLAALSAAAVAPAAAAATPPAAAPAVAQPAQAAPAAPAPAAPAAPPTATSPALSPEADMERRLRTLKDLREKGLITEEAYRAKIEEILSVL